MNRLWKIRGHGDHCSLTGQPFREGEVIYSCLVASTDSSGFHREDYCLAAWADICSQRAPFCFWRSTYEVRPAPAGKRDQAPAARDAEGLLQQLMEQDEPSTEITRYILALTLERKRILRQAGHEHRAGRRLLVYEHLDSGELMLITDPEVSLDQVAKVEQEVGRCLNLKSIEREPPPLSNQRVEAEDGLVP